MKLKRVTILGGTGTLGRELVSQITENSTAEITIVSRDEHKQAQMKRDFPKCRYIIGDIRDPGSFNNTFEGRDAVFHVAALKHVDVLEHNPIECIKTNVLATDNIIRNAIAKRVPFVVFSSTDKAVDPINTYGYSKALSEKLFYEQNRQGSQTRFGVYRWGNVLGSQGSAVHYFRQTLIKERKAYITHKDMTRFWIPIEWAVTYMLRTYGEMYPDRAMVPPTMRAAKVVDVIEAIANLNQIYDYDLVETGTRPGEKIHEAMYSQHSDWALTSENAEQYSFEQLLELLQPIVGGKIFGKVA